MYKLFCDSNCELWHTTIEELGLEVIKMPYTLGDKEYFYDMGKDTDFEGFFKAMREGAVPKTSALNEYAYTEYFEPVLAAGQDIFYITFSHAMSATFNAMNSAIAALKQKYPERTVRTVDTKTISLGAGFIVYYAAHLTYLYRGGRVSGVSKVFGNLLNIKPILCFNDEGKIVNIDKQKGFKKAMAALRGYMAEKAEGLDKYKVFVLQADCPEAAKTFVADIKAQFPAADVVVQPVGPVIGSHCGPGTIGLIFHAKER